MCASRLPRLVAPHRCTTGALVGHPLALASRWPFATDAAAPQLLQGRAAESSSLSLPSLWPLHLLQSRLVPASLLPLRSHTCDLCRGLATTAAASAVCSLADARSLWPLSHVHLFSANVMPFPRRWHPDIPAVATVSDGELFRVETVDWTGGQRRHGAERQPDLSLFTHKRRRPDQGRRQRGGREDRRPVAGPPCSSQGALCQ